MLETMLYIKKLISICSILDVFSFMEISGGREREIKTLFLLSDLKYVSFVVCFILNGTIEYEKSKI